MTTTFALPSAGLSLLFGRLADLYGRRCIFSGGLALLAVASLLGGISTGSTLLLIARTLQGVATAMTAPAASALLITTFTDQGQRAPVHWAGAEPYFRAASRSERLLVGCSLER
jgi:MFS family permease